MKCVSETLDLQHSFEEPEVLDSECLLFLCFLSASFFLSIVVSFEIIFFAILFPSTLCGHSSGTTSSSEAAHSHHMSLGTI